MMTSDRNDIRGSRVPSIEWLVALLVVGLIPIGCAQQPATQPTPPSPTFAPRATEASSAPVDEFTGPISTVPSLPSPSIEQPMP
jgi:hypothetical protein